MAQEQAELAERQEALQKEHEEVQRFADASKFLWAVRCHLHNLAGHAFQTRGHIADERRVDVGEDVHAFFREFR